MKIFTSFLALFLAAFFIQESINTDYLNRVTVTDFSAGTVEGYYCGSDYQDYNLMVATIINLESNFYEQIYDYPVRFGECNFYIGYWEYTPGERFVLQNFALTHNDPVFVFSNDVPKYYPPKIFLPLIKQ